MKELASKKSKSKSSKNILVRDVPAEYLKELDEMRKSYQEKTGRSLSRQEVFLQLISHSLSEKLFQNQFNYFYEANENTKSEIESLKKAVINLTQNIDFLIEILLSINK